MARATFNELLEAIGDLPAEEQADLLAIARQRLAEQGRQRIVRDAEEARADYRNGATAPASVEEIMREIES